MIKKVAIGIVVVFAAIGLLFTAVFIAMQFGLLNVRGASSTRNASLVGANDIQAVSQKGSVCVADSAGVVPKTCQWQKTVEWQALRDGIAKDRAVIDRVSKEVGVDSRMIAAAVVPEQLRYFTANRESFKKYFEPLKILSSMSKFSLGVSGIKQDTAVLIEQYANDPSSPFYPGEGIAALLAYPEGVDRDTALYNRLTDSRNHYYSYLYTAVYLKEISAQWQRAGFDVSKQPEVLVTLFNIGFKASQPKSTPATGGAVITLGGAEYNFGELGSLFYRSEELRSVFP